MSNSARIVRAVAMSCAICWVSVASATETQQGPLSELQRCRTLADTGARAACYDRATDALTAATAAKDVVILNRRDVREAKRGLFGFTIGKLPFFGGSDDSDKDNTELQTTVVSARGIGYGKWRFSVEGGALWETVEASPRSDDPRPGASILIVKANFGAYYAKVGKSRRVQVKRIG